MRIQAKWLCTEVPDDEEYKEKGLKGEMIFKIGYAPHIPAGEIKPIGHFALSPMPGNCGMVVSTDTYLSTDYRGRGLTEDFHDLKALVAKHFGYTVMISTVELRNMPQVVSASGRGWKFKHYFRNKRTDHDIGIATKDL